MLLPDISMNKTTRLRVVEGDIYIRSGGMHYVHRRIPAALRLAYPPTKTHITKSLGTKSLAAARSIAPRVVAAIAKEFDEKRSRIDLGHAHRAPVRVTSLSERQAQGMLDFWLRSALLTDDHMRAAEFHGEDVDELEEHLQQQRQELRRRLGRGETQEFAAVFQHFLSLCGVLYEPPEDELRAKARVFLARVVKSLDIRLQRLSGEVIETDDVVAEAIHPLYLIAPERAPRSLQAPTWESVFEVWRDHVKNRPKATAVSNMTAWRDLRSYCESRKLTSPTDITDVVMADFVTDMEGRLDLDTAADRLAMIRKIFGIARAKRHVGFNPAEFTVVSKQNKMRRRSKKRLPFSDAELTAVFSSQVYREQRRSEGQSGEATYWIPVIMHYTGARPEEVAGLALSDVRQAEDGSWYFRIINRFDDQDVDLFDDEGDQPFDARPVPDTHWRTLKNQSSNRRVPIVPQLLDLGLFRYLEHVRSMGEAVLFPTLKMDCVGKLSGAFVKVFSRIKLRELGMTDKRKVLYSLRHNMKDLLERAEIPSKALKRILGHTPGDGATTDGYGSDLPYELVQRHFAKVTFPVIPALPWEPGRGDLKYPRQAARPA
jgi:integrase